MIYRYLDIFNLKNHSFIWFQLIVCISYPEYSQLDVKRVVKLVVEKLVVGPGIRAKGK